jgi:heavy metal sensor kinase
VTRLSIGARWTIRFAAALLVAVSLFAGYSYVRIEAGILQDAKLILDLQLEELEESLIGRQPDSKKVVEAVELSTLVANPDLKLGLQIFDRDGELKLGRGSLAIYELEYPKWIRDTAESRIVREVDFGENYPYLVIARRLDDGRVVQGALYMRRFIRSGRDVRDVYLWALPLTLGVTLALGMWLVRGSLRPISEITQTARRISGTHLDEEIPVTGTGDELDELAHTLNDMMDRIRRSVGRMRRFSANAAHELRTPINALRSRLEVTLEQERTPDEYRKILGETAEQMATLTESVQAMMRLAQSEAGLRAEDRVPVELGPLLRDVAEFFEPLADEQGLKLEVGPIAEASIDGEPTWLHRCFANLIDNAVRYTPEGGSINVCSELVQEGAAIEVRVRDTGIGIAPKEHARVFEPYHRVREGSRETRGAGLGLPLVREIARAHGGDCTLESTLGHGAQFTIRLPLDG